MVQLAWRFALAFLLLNLMILFGWEKLHLRGKKLKPLILLSTVEPLYFFAKLWHLLFKQHLFRCYAGHCPHYCHRSGNADLEGIPHCKAGFAVSASHCRCGFGDHCGDQNGGRAASQVLLVLGACLFAAFYRVYNKGRLRSSQPLSGPIS